MGIQRFTLLLGALLAGTPSLSAAPSWDRVVEVDILLSDFSFAPSELHLRQGQAYRLHLVNNGSGGHNFAAPDFFAAAQIDPEDAGALSKGRIEIGKGQALDVRLIPAAGTYKIKCTHFMHAAFGMKGRITVD